MANHNNWDKPLPARLSSTSTFLLNIENTDLEESYVDSSGDLVIVAGIDDIVYTKVFTYLDILAIGEQVTGPHIIRNYTPKLPLNTSIPSSAGVEHSMACFRKNNPTMEIP